MFIYFLINIYYVIYLNTIYLHIYIIYKKSIKVLLIYTFILISINNLNYIYMFIYINY